MGCTEEKYICFSKKKRFNKNKGQENKNEIDNIESKKSIDEENKENLKQEEKKELEEKNNNESDNNNNNNIEDIKEENKENEKKEDNDNEEEDYDISYSNIEMARQLEPYLQTKNNPNFNFPEVKDNIYVGKGLRKMKGYISIVTKEELEKRRRAFWGTRIEGNSQVWNFLKELCELPLGEEKNMKAMLEANEITPLQKCINVTYDKAGEDYEIPNYCINEPVSYDLPEMHVKKPDKKLICFHVRKGIKQIKIKSPNNALVDKIKRNIANKMEVKEENIRMFFGGKELKNGNELWKYNIDDNCVVILL
jgi:hypothetical protein